MSEVAERSGENRESGEDQIDLFLALERFADEEGNNPLAAYAVAAFRTLISKECQPKESPNAKEDLLEVQLTRLKNEEKEYLNGQLYHENGFLNHPLEYLSKAERFVDITREMAHTYSELGKKELARSFAQLAIARGERFMEEGKNAEHSHEGSQNVSAQNLKNAIGEARAFLVSLGGMLKPHNA